MSFTFIFPVCIHEGQSAMIDNVVYERSVSECIKIGYLQQKYKKFWTHTPLPSVCPHLHPKMLGTPLFHCYVLCLLKI